MKIKILLALICFGSITNVFGIADPGSTGLTFDKSILLVNQTGKLEVAIGNYSAGSSLGTALAPNDATFTITIPADLKVEGPIDFSKVNFTVTIQSMVTDNAGATVIVLAVPDGIAKGESGYITIPVIGVKQSIAILYATVEITPNLSSPPSGDITPSNNFQSTPVVVFNALPVTLISFQAVKENSTVNLSWSTTEEINSDRFDVEHSKNGKQWNIVGSVTSNGESKIKRDYNFVHQNPVAGNNYYRLKMVDKNLTFAYSAIRNADVEGLALEVYPNPVAETLVIGNAIWKNISNVQLMNIRGMEVYNSGNTPVPNINVRDLKAGIYVVKITKTDGSAAMQKIVVAR